jgi:hypothetical protein
MEHALPRTWSLCMTSENHGTVGPAGCKFSHAPEKHERVLVVEVPAAAGWPVDQVNLKLVAGPVAAPAGQVAVPGWVNVDERLPDVPANDYREFIVSCKRANGKSYVFAAHYLNQKMLPSRWPDDDEPEEGLPCTGWHHEAEVDGDNVFTEACESGDAVTHWMQLPAAPSPAKESK